MADSAKRDPWAVALSEALRKWCRENGYVPVNRLAHELGIVEHRWQLIIGGKGIAEGGGKRGEKKDETIYARLYLRTGLTQADPRTIPSRKSYVPKTKSHVDRVRAWTDGQLASYRETAEAKGVLALAKEKGEADSTKASTPLALEKEQKPSLGALDLAILGIVRLAIDEANKPLADLLEEIKELLQRLRTTETASPDQASSSRPVQVRQKEGTSLAVSISWLTEVLGKILEGSDEEINRIAALHGRDLARLNIHINPFTLQGEDRRRTLASLRMTRGHTGR